MHGSNHCETPELEARKVYHMLVTQAQTVDGDMWASILINCAKLLFEVAQSTESI